MRNFENANVLLLKKIGQFSLDRKLLVTKSRVQFFWRIKAFRFYILNLFKNHDCKVGNH